MFPFAQTATKDDGHDPTSSTIAVHPKQGGCQLEATVSPSALRSSLHALLAEMSRNGIDPENARVLKDMEEIVLGGDGDGDGGSEAEPGGTALLRRMLLPLYRVRTRQSDLSQRWSQPDSPAPDSPALDGVVGTPGYHHDGTRTVMESSSLVKVLLRVDVLQPTLLTALLQTLHELAGGAAEDEEGGAAASRDDDVPRLVFSNIRWLDHIVDAAGLTAAFLGCLTVLAPTSASCSRTKGVLIDAIATLPDVLHGADALTEACDGDEDGEEGADDPILSTLQDLRAEDPTLLVPCLDAIGSLPLTEGQRVRATRDALEALANVEAWGLPALTGFLMHHCPAGGGHRGLLGEMIEELRKLPLGGAGGEEDEEAAEADRGGRIRRVGHDSRSNDGLMIEALSRGFSHRADLAAALLRAIKDTPAHQGHPPADLWLLACCASAPHHRPKVHSVFKAKAASGGFAPRLLREALEGNGAALGSLFSASLCGLADGLLRSSDAAGSALGVALYEVLFWEFAEPMQRQEVVGSLVTHVGSGVGVKPGEVDAALRAFCGIVDGEGTGETGTTTGRPERRAAAAAALRPFAPFLTSMLDHLHHMTPGQVRRLFLLLFAVGVEEEGAEVAGEARGGSMGGAVTDIVIRKHLNLASFEKKRIVSISSFSQS